MHARIPEVMYKTSGILVKIYDGFIWILLAEQLFENDRDLF